jgi:hypothetical protein
MLLDERLNEKLGVVYDNRQAKMKKLKLGLSTSEGDITLFRQTQGPFEPDRHYIRCGAFKLTVKVQAAALSPSIIQSSRSTV